ncbi:hypothetical protein CS078_18275 [Pseudomonas prosekii]|jgi:hypothetical protein|uniref:Uncharacterized protein n=1 Tax=Pseudomonas prosekii TaxID=1148509 RepID=A0A3L8CIP0_9PSED|nr:hypothetical protein CS078_18275 [Pseudomonas prosekii]
MVANVLESVSEKSAGHYRLCEGFSYAGAPFDFFIVKPGRGESPQFVPSSFMDTFLFGCQSLLLSDRHRFKDH